VQKSESIVLTRTFQQAAHEMPSRLWHQTEDLVRYQRYGLGIVSESALDDRQTELAQAFVDAWERSGHVPFDFPPDRPLSHPAWPTSVQPPTHDAVRGLLSLRMLEFDKSASPTWRVYPSPAARVRFGDDRETQVAAALKDPEQRLGLILEAIVEAFYSDPAEPLRLWPRAGADLVRHPGWPLQPDVVRAHDLRQLEELGLVSVSSQSHGYDFWPTADGRAAVHDPAGLLERRSDATSSEPEASRLREWAQRLRAGEFAVGVAASGAWAAIAALLIR